MHPRLCECPSAGPRRGLAAMPPYGGMAPFSVGADLRLTAFASQPFNAGVQAAQNRPRTIITQFRSSMLRLGFTIFLRPGPPFSGAWVGASGLRYFSSQGRPFRARGSALWVYDISPVKAALFGRVGRRLGLTIFLWPGPPFSGAWVSALGLRYFSSQGRPFRARGSAPRAYDISLAGAALFGRVGQRFGFTIFLQSRSPFSSA